MPSWVASPLHRAIVQALVGHRQSANITQRELATRLDRPPSYVAKIETIERNLAVHEFIEWCRALDIDPAQVLNEADRAR